MKRKEMGIKGDFLLGAVLPLDKIVKIIYDRVWMEKCWKRDGRNAK